MGDFTYIAYHVPSDGDSEDAPNMFVIRKPAASVTLLDVKQNFPLLGSYFFRAKVQYKKTYVWLDLLDDARPVPLFGTSIVLKVARLTFEDSTVPPSSAPSGPSPTRFSAPAPAPAATTRPEPKAPAPAPVAAPVAAPRPAAPAASDNLLDIEFTDSSSSSASAPSFDPFSQQAPLGATSFSGLVSSGLTPMTLPASSARPAQAAGSPIWPGASPRGVPVMGFAAPPMAAQGRPAAGRPPAPGIRF